MALKSRCKMMINGKEVENFKNYKPSDREIAKTAKMMNGSDYFDVDPEYLFEVDYVCKKGQVDYPFESVLDGTANVRFPMIGGGADLWGDCKLLNIADSGMDGEKERVKTIKVFANSYTED